MASVGRRRPQAAVTDNDGRPNLASRYTTEEAVVAQAWLRVWTRALRERWRQGDARAAVEDECGPADCVLCFVTHRMASWDDHEEADEVVPWLWSIDPRDSVAMVPFTIVHKSLTFGGSLVYRPQRRTYAVHVGCARLVADAGVLTMPSRWALCSGCGRTMLVHRRARQSRCGTCEPRQRTCAQCGAPFSASRSDARYCSGRCRVAAHRART